MSAVGRVVYLLAVAIGVFFVRDPRLLGGLLAAQLALGLIVGIPAGRLLRQLRKLVGFAVLIIASFALTAQDPATDAWIHVPLGPFALPLNTAGAVLGLLMMVRIATVVVASLVARSGDPSAVAHGLSRLGLPRMASASIDTVLALFGDDEGSRGRGRGGGGGRGTGGGRGANESGEGFWHALRRLGRGDVGPIVARLERQIERAQRHVGAGDLGRESPAVAADVGVIAGISLTMLGIRALKVLPSVPFAPGHKLVLLTPLYIVASLLTRSRFGSTATGAAMGVTSFLMGDGRYGVFEVAKHLAPGLISDLGVPWLVGGGRRPGALAWTLFGGVIAVGRFATIFAMTLLVQAPAVAWAILVPGMVVHVTFGMLSGYVTAHLVRGMVPAQRDAEPVGRPTGGESPTKA